MARPKRPGQTPAQTGHRANIDLGGILGGIGGGVKGGGPAPAVKSPFGEDIGAPSSVNPTPSGGDFTPYTAAHPTMDALFNHGQGNNLAMQLNAARNNLLIQGQQGLDIEGLRGKNTLANTGLENTGKLDVTRLVGEQAIRSMHEAAAEGRMTAAEKATQDILAKNGLTPAAKDEFEGIVQPKNVENLSNEGLNALKQTSMMSKVLADPSTQEAMGSGFRGKLLDPVAKNLSLGPKIDTGQSYYGVGDSASRPILGQGKSQGGMQTTQRKTFTPQGIPSGEITTTSPTPGQPGSFGQSLEKEGDYDLWNNSKAGTPQGDGLTALPSTVSPQDPELLPPVNPMPSAGNALTNPPVFGPMPQQQQVDPTPGGSNPAAYMQSLIGQGLGGIFNKFKRAQQQYLFGPLPLQKQ